MALITVLLALIAEHYLGTMEEFRRYGWFRVLTDRVRGALPENLREGTLALLLVLAIPFLAVALVAELLGEVWLVFELLFGLAVLLYSFGAQDLEAQLEALVDARERGDEESARWHAAGLVGGAVPEEPQQLTRAVMENALVAVNERLLAVVFWFALLGPAGALAWRMVLLLRERYRDGEGEFAQAAQRLHYILAWAPARLTALGFALSGNFVDAMQYWREEALKWRDHNRGVLVSAGFGALQLGDVPEQTPDPERDTEYLKETIALVRRTVIVWVAALAVFTLAGWAG